MATIHELPSKESRGIPPELANLTREGLQEYMLSTIRESVFSGFETSPEVVAVTLRRWAARYFWDITLSCAYYTNRDAPADQFTRYFWDLRIPDDVYAITMGGEQYETPEAAYAAAVAYLATNSERLIPDRADYEDPAEGERAVAGGG